MVLMAGIRRIARHGIGAGTATIRGIARGTTRGTIHGTTTAGVGTILLGLGRAIRSLLLSRQTKPVTQLHFGRFRQRLTIRQPQHDYTQPA